MPQLCDQEGVEERLSSDAREARFGKRCLVNGKPAGLESGESSEGKVEAGDEEACRSAKRIVRCMKVRDEPERAGGKLRQDTLDKRIQLRLCEAVEEEVSDNEIICFVVFRDPCQCIGMFDLQAIAVGGAAFAEKA